MNQIKIGKFIKKRRMSKKLTQQDLADKLHITDRAVSKWETGKCLPDASLMIELCNILSISVNELLNGEMLSNKDYSSKYDDLLIELKKEEENKNKKLIFSMWSMLLITLMFFIETIILIMSHVNEKDISIWMIISLFIFILSCMIIVKIELDAGYYECKNCNYRFVPKFLNVFFSAHVSTTRKLKCPKCGKKTWSKKVMNK